MVDNPLWEICERAARVQAVLGGKSWISLAKKHR